MTQYTFFTLEISNAAQRPYYLFYVKHDLELPSRNTWENYYYSKNLLVDGNPSQDPDRLPMRKVDFSSVRKLGVEYNDVNHWSLCSGDNHQVEK